MKIFTRQTVLAVAIILSAAANGVCGADTKIAVVDMSKAMRAHPRTASNRKILEKEVEQYKEEQRKMLDEIESIQKNFDEARKESANKALSEKAREKKLARAEKYLEQLREARREMVDVVRKRRQELDDHRTRMAERVVDKLRDIITKYAEKEGYDLVLDSAALSASGVNVLLYKAGKTDITDAVLERISK